MDKKKNIPNRRDLQTLSLFVILGGLTIIVMWTLSWVLFVPGSQLPTGQPPAAIEAGR